MTFSLDQRQGYGSRPRGGLPLIPPKEGGLGGHSDVGVHRLVQRVEHGALDDGLLYVSLRRCFPDQ